MTAPNAVTIHLLEFEGPYTISRKFPRWTETSWRALGPCQFVVRRGHRDKRFVIVSIKGMSQTDEIQEALHNFDMTEARSRRPHASGILRLKDWLQ